MKKLSLYVFLVLMWCNVAFAEIIFERCSGLEPNLFPRAKWTINLEKEIIKEVSGTNNAIKYWRINKNFGDTIITFELLEASDATDNVAQTLMSFLDMKYVFDIKEETLSMNIELSDLGKANKEVTKWFNEEVSSGGILKYVSGNCIVKNLYTKKEKPKKSNNDNLVLGNKLIFKDCKLSPNYDPGTTITVDLSKKVIKITEPEGTSEYYDVKTVYGDLIVSSNIKFATGISDNDLNEIRSILAMELKLDTDNKTVSITWDLLNGSGKMYDFFKKQFKSGKKVRHISSKCKLENL